MEWTRQAPTEPGFYWVYRPSVKQRRLVEVCYPKRPRDDTKANVLVVYEASVGQRIYLGYYSRDWWQGPITAPEPPTKEQIDAAQPPVH